MQAIVETSFDVVYLTTVITVGILMIRGSRGNRQFRLFGMMAVLLALHDDWAISPHRDYVKMETTTLEYNIIVDALLAAGYTADDFILQTEYTRKWGML